MISHPSRPATLSDWLLGTYRLSRDISTDTLQTYVRAIQTTQRWAGQELTAANISDELVNASWLRMIQAGRSPHYVRSVKTSVATVWRDMADAGLCRPPRRLRVIRCPRPAHTVWTAHEVAQLLHAAQAVAGQFRTLPLTRSIYWDTLVRIAWDTGLRRRDLQRLRKVDIAADWLDCQHKTQKPIRCRLRASTLEAIEQWGRADDDVLWPLWGTDETFRQAWARIVRSAGIAQGPFKTLRKSAGTAAEAIQPGAGHLLLGNTRAVFERHYLDASQVDPPRPPEIG